MAAGFALIAALHLLNPDTIVARTNIARAKAGRRQPALRQAQGGEPSRTAQAGFDARHATRLSADAVAALVAGLLDLSPADRCAVAAGLLERWPPLEPLDWVAWNGSRAQALRVVSENQTRLRAQTCSEQK
jgi:hypothetical protein